MSVGNPSSNGHLPNYRPSSGERARSAGMPRWAVGVLGGVVVGLLGIGTVIALSGSAENPEEIRGRNAEIAARLRMYGARLQGNGTSQQIPAAEFTTAQLAQATNNGRFTGIHALKSVEGFDEPRVLGLPPAPQTSYKTDGKLPFDWSATGTTDSDPSGMPTDAVVLTYNVQPDITGDCPPLVVASSTPLQNTYISFASGADGCVVSVTTNLERIAPSAKLVFAAAE